MGWAEILTSIFGGGFTGLFGGVINKVFDYYATKEKLKHDEIMYDKQTAYLKLETARDVQIAKEQANAQIEVADAQALSEGYKADSATYIPKEDIGKHPTTVILLTIVDTVRGLVRPILTFYLCIVVTLLFMKIDGVVKRNPDGLTTEQAYGLYKLILLSIIFLANTAVCWWFSSRAKFKDLMDSSTTL